MSKKRFVSVLIACSVLFSLSACQNKEEEEVYSYPVTVFGTDFDVAPTSIVSLSPSVTEDLDRLGLLQTVAGQSSYCDTDYINPPDHTIEVVGSPINPETDSIIKLAPTHVFTSTPMPDWMKNKLSAANTTVVNVSTPQYLYSIFGRAHDICTALLGLDEGMAYADETLLDTFDLVEAISWQYMYADKPSSLFIVNADLVVFTGDTLIQDFMTVFGLKNAASASTEYTYSEEQLLADNPEYIFLADTMDKAAFAEKYPDLQAVVNSALYSYDLSAFERGDLGLIDTFEAIARDLTPADMAVVDTSLQQLADEREAAAIEVAKPWYTKTWEKVQEFFSNLFGGDDKDSSSVENSSSK